MKKLAGLIIILAVLILGGYYGMGFLTERTIKKNIEVINQMNGLSANVEQYHRGWFSSNAQIKWNLHVPERSVKQTDGNTQIIAARDYQMSMPIKIFHGPFIISNKMIHFGVGYAETEFPFPEEYDKQFAEQFANNSTKPQLYLNIFVNYFLRSTIEFSVPEFKLFTKDGSGTITWNGLGSALNMSSDKDQLDGEVIMEGLSFTKEDTVTTLGKIVTKYDVHQTKAGLYLGDASFDLPSFVITDKNQTIVNLKDLNINSNSDIENDLFSLHFNLGIKTANLNQKIYGPGTLEVILRNLDANVLAKINQQASTMQNSTDAERQQVMIAILPDLPKLFSQGAEFEISKLSLKIPEGSIDGKLLISLPKGEHSNPLEIAQKIQGNARLKVPAALLKQLMTESVAKQMTKQPDMQQVLIQQLQMTNPSLDQQQVTNEQLATMQAEKQLSTLEKNGVLILSGSDYMFEATLENGKLLINGKPFDSSMLKY